MMLRQHSLHLCATSSASWRLATSAAARANSAIGACVSTSLRPGHDTEAFVKHAKYPDTASQARCQCQEDDTQCLQNTHRPRALSSPQVVGCECPERVGASECLPHGLPGHRPTRHREDEQGAAGGGNGVTLGADDGRRQLHRQARQAQILHPAAGGQPYARHGFACPSQRPWLVACESCPPALRRSPHLASTPGRPSPEFLCTVASSSRVLT